MRLSEWAKREGVSYITAWRWWNDGKLPVPARKVGKLILVDVPEPGQGRTVLRRWPHRDAACWSRTRLRPTMTWYGM